MDTSRRLFLTRLPVAATAAQVWAGTAHALAAAGGADAGNEAYWRLLHRQFPLEDNLIYLNAANVCPASRPVLDRYTEYLRDFQANPSFQNREKYEALAERTRAKLARLLGCDSTEVALTRNTSEATNIIVNGLDLNPGDEVILTSHNHPSNADSWKVRARRHGFTVKVVPVPVPARSRDELIATIDGALSARTRVIAITHVTNTTGNLYPAREISELARRRDIWVHLDGAQSFAALRFNLRELGCDSYAGSAHKWLMGPLEAGVLFVRADRISRVWPSIVSAGWSDSTTTARKFEVYGQRDNPRLVAVEAAADFVELIGLANIEARLRYLVARAQDQLGRIPGVTLKTSTDPALSLGVIKFDLARLPTKQAYDLLWQRHRIAIAHTPAGDARGLRFSPHVYNTVEEIDRAVAAVRELAA